MNGPVSILIVDDHALVRNMLADRLSREPDLTVCATASDAGAAVLEFNRCRPDIVLMDIDMPGLVSFEAARKIKQSSANTEIIFLSAYTNDRYIEQALTVGAAGYVTKGEPVETVIEAIRAVADGDCYFSPEVRSRLVVQPSGATLTHARQSLAALLTNRELEMLRYVARGMSQKEIATLTGVSPQTVHRHCNNLMSKLDIHDRVDLARYAIREGLAEA